MERQPHQQICLSAQDNVDMKTVLGEIIDKAVYQKDYNDITALLIFDDVKYEDAIKTLKAVKDFI